MNKSIFSVALVSMLFLGCKNEQGSISSVSSKSQPDSNLTVSQSVKSSGHNSKTSLDWAGSYKGVTPCASCSGIETEIILSQQMTFEIKTKYLGKKEGKIFVEKGTFSWNSSGTIITLEKLENRPSQYKVGENKLIQLDLDGREITGELEENYVLRK